MISDSSGLLKLAGMRALHMVGVSLLALAPAHAQDGSGAAGTGAAEEAAAPSGGDIVVTASRVNREGYNAPTPTTIVGADALAARGETNIGALLNELPAFKASTSATTNGVRSIMPGSVYADLRGLGQTRTLVLVDGNRFVPQITTGLGTYQVDLNQVPSLMVERTEIVTGGASAQWGSDAVAGVVNIMLRKRFEGLEAEIQHGFSELGDNKELRLGLVGGFRIGDRAHLTVGIDYVDNKGVKDVFTRDWGRKGYGILINPCPLAAAVSASCPTGGNGQAQQLIVPDVRFSTATPGGMINNVSGPAAALRGITFGPGGTIGRFGYGDYAGSQYMQGGGSNALININDGVYIKPAGRRQIAYGRFDYDVADAVAFHAELSHAWSRGQSQTLPPRNEQANPIVVRLDNPFIPDALRTVIDTYNAANPASPITSFNVGRYSTDIGRGRSEVTNKTTRAVAGFDGELDGGWNWSANYIHGRNDYRQQVENNRILANFNYAADVTTDTNGVPVCRGVLNGVAAAAGCVPLNIFGVGAPSADAIDYVTGTLHSRTLYVQNAANFNVTGEPFSTWAGPVSLAFGVEWRHEKQRTSVDPIAEAAGYETTNARSLRGSFSVKEAYVETVVPVARDLAFAQSLDLNGAVRVADYSTAAGTQVTWKAGATWNPVDDILVRVARSRDIRAPNIFEMVTPPVSTIRNLAFANGVDGGPAGNLPTQQLIGGNPDLKPEKADTFTAGIALTPRAVPGLSLSVDYYNITVKDAIVALNSDIVTNSCAVNNDPYFCSFISRAPAGSAATYILDTPYQNLAKQQRTGLDFSATYRLPLENIASSLDGALTLRVAANHVIHYREDAVGTGYIERAGETSASGSPRWFTNSSLSLDVSPAFAMLQMRTISAGKYNKLFVEGVNINENDVEGRTYFDLSGSYKLTSRFQLFAAVDNLFDRDPPMAPANFAFPTSPIYFDMIGRSFRLGLRVKM